MRLAEVRTALSILRYGVRAKMPSALAAEVEKVRRKAQTWMRGTHIVGIGIGRSSRRGPDLDYAINLLLDRRRVGRWLLREIPEIVCIPGIGRPIPIEVETTSPMRPQNGHVRPVVGGDSVGRSDGGGGTFGCTVRWLRDPAPDALYLLSNAHVLAFGGSAKPTKGDEIISPPLDKGGRPGKDKIATLAYWTEFEPGEDRLNVADAAIARLADGVASPAIASIGPPAGVNTHVDCDMEVQIGTRAGISTGQVQKLDFGLDLTYSQPGEASRSFGFSGQVLCSRFTVPGDSGSAVLDRGRQIVGLHLAGSDDYSVFTPIKTVLDLLELTVETNILATAQATAAQLPLGFIPEVGSYYKALDVLARTLWGEARGEGKTGMIAVAAVVANRTHAQQPVWGLTVEAVCQMPNQFSCWNPGEYRNLVEAVDTTDPSFPACLAISRDTLGGQIKDPTGGATHYYNPNEATPGWAKGVQGVPIGKHIFLKL